MNDSQDMPSDSECGRKLLIQLPMVSKTGSGSPRYAPHRRHLVSLDPALMLDRRLRHTINYSLRYMI